MKRVLMMMCAMGFSVCAEPKPKAEAHLRITDDLPKLRVHPSDGYSGVFSVTNTGEVAFIVITDSEWADATRFYQEGDEEKQRYEDEYGRGKQRREEERAWARRLYEGVVQKYPASTKVLQPGESISFEYKDFTFLLPYGVPGGVYKAEMYLGNDAWAQIYITPTLYTLGAVSWNKDKTPGDFFYSKEGTNQYLYVKTDGKFKRVGEMKLGSRPEKEKDEEAVTFESPDGVKKKLTREQARQIIREREQQNQ